MGLVAVESAACEGVNEASEAVMPMSGIVRMKRMEVEAYLK